MVKVANPDDSDNPTGMAALREIVLKRLIAANVTQWTDAFDSFDTRDYLCRMSSETPSPVLILIRSATCTVAGALPLTRRVVRQAVRGINDFERALNHPDFFQDATGHR
ncbi:MAG: hypothetical protein R3F36_05540 [Candidatus Competibacteraceae bacterium]